MPRVSETCDTCGQRIIQGNIAFGKMFAKMLWLAEGFSRRVEAVWKVDRADKTSETRSEWIQHAFLAKDFLKVGIPVGLYNNLSKLRHWNLTSQRPEWWHQGIYQLTIGAEMFMRGQTAVSKELTVKGEFVISESPETLTYEQAWGKAWLEIADHIATWRGGHAIQGQRELF